MIRLFFILLFVAAGSLAAEFSIVTKASRNGEGATITRYIAQLETNRLSFIPPLGWSIKADPTTRSIRMSPRDFQGALSIRFVELPAEALTATNLEEQVFRAGLVDARILSTAVEPTAGVMALVVECAPALVPAARTRDVVFPYAGGLVQVRLNSSLDQYSELLPVCSALVASLRIESARPVQAVR